MQMKDTRIVDGGEEIIASIGIISQLISWHESFPAIAGQPLQITRVNFGQMEKTVQHVKDFAGIPYANEIHAELCQD